MSGTRAGQTLGALCVIGTEPRQITAQQMGPLQFMARQVITMPEARIAERGEDPA